MSKKILKIIIKTVVAVIGLYSMIFVLQISFHTQSEFKEKYGFEAPSNMIPLWKHPLGLCTINIFSFCNLDYRFEHVDRVKFEEVMNKSLAAGYNTWAEPFNEFYVGNYKDGRHDISREGMRITQKSKCIHGDGFMTLVYYPSNQTLDAVIFCY